MKIGASIKADSSPAFLSQHSVALLSPEKSVQVGAPVSSPTLKSDCRSGETVVIPERARKSSLLPASLMSLCEQLKAEDDGKSGTTEPSDPDSHSRSSDLSHTSSGASLNPKFTLSEINTRLEKFIHVCHAQHAANSSPPEDDSKKKKKGRGKKKKQDPWEPQFLKIQDMTDFFWIQSQLVLAPPPETAKETRLVESVMRLLEDAQNAMDEVLMSSGMESRFFSDAWTKHYLSASPEYERKDKSHTVPEMHTRMVFFYLVFSFFYCFLVLF